MAKKICMMAVIVCSICSYAFTASTGSSEGQSEANRILREVDKIITLKDTRSEQMMSVCRENATIRQYKLKVMTSGSDKAFAEIIEPEQFKGQQFLRLSDTVWLYLPGRVPIGFEQYRLKTPIRISGRDTFMGGDFSNNDVLRTNLADDYTPELIEDLPDQYVLELKSKDLNVAYAMIRLWVRKDDFQPIKQEFYSINDILVKSVFFQDYRDYGGGFIRPGIMEVKSAVMPKSKTFLEILYLIRHAENEPQRFLRDSLGK